MEEASSSLYVSINFLLALLAYVSQWPPKSGLLWVNFTTTVIGTTFTEFPLYIILLKVWMWYAMATDAWFIVPITSIRLLTSISDIFTMSMLLYNFYKNYKTRQIIFTLTRKFEHYGHELPSITSSRFWFRFMLPLYIPTNVKVLRDITYGTSQELREVGKPYDSYLKLDIYAPRNVRKPDRRPVMIFIHGGSWMTMDKSIPYPQPWYLSSNGWIVCSLNYRLAPKNPYPACLIDCKRALRWVKENIYSYGGDPNFVAVSGDSSGCHLATMLSLTANDERYQPGFEHVDTKVQACVGINGVYDVTNRHNVFAPSLVPWFASKICGKSGDLNEEGVWEMLEDASPETLVERKGDCNEEIVPFLLFHGDNDQVAGARGCEEFVKTFRKISPKSEIVYIEFPGAHHGYHCVSSPRTHYSMIAMLRFLNWAYHHTSSSRKNLTEKIN